MVRKRSFWVAVGVLAFVWSGAVLAGDFNGTGIGPIPDNNASGIVVSFAVSGMTAPVSKVSLKLGLTHTWVGDLNATLTSPGGVAHLVVFARTGATRTVGTGTGDSSNLSGVYEFTDRAANDWYAMAASLPDGGVIPPGQYRTTTAGVPTTSAPAVAGTNHGGCSTSLKGAFNGLAPADANGIWTLAVSDHFAGDSGSVTSAVLSVGNDNIFANGFDAPVRGSCAHTLYDYTGTGRASFALTRAVGSDIQWLVQDNDGTTTGAVSTFTLGSAATDYIVDGDFDGDGIADAAVWTEAAAGVAKFSIRRSSRPDQPYTIVFGQTGDDPAQCGDYDGDGMTDAAVFRSVDFGTNPAHTLIHPSSGASDRNYITGEDGNFAVGGLDYTGDGIADIAIQSTFNVNDGHFRIYDGVDGDMVLEFLQGQDSDFIIPGNMVGTTNYDITTRRTVVNDRQYTTRDMGTQVVQPIVLWGTVGDTSINGDYDGDGLDDYAVWRGSATPGMSQFIIRRSSDLGTLTYPMGQAMDFPPAGSRVH
jgi:subtilisin-like proprotein convertase family protein